MSIMHKLPPVSVILLLLNFFQVCDNAAISGNETSTAQRVHKGYYIYGHEIDSFQPCAQKLVYWVNGSDEVPEILQQNYFKHSSEPYAEVYVELTGDFRPKASDGFAMDYDGQFQVESMLKMNKKSGHECMAAG